MELSKKELGQFLIEKAALYARESFVSDDPIQIPHSFSKPRDIEISGLIAATLSWGSRKTIIAKSAELMDRMDQSPADFIMNATESELASLEGFKHRTFQSIDIQGLVIALKALYLQYDTIGNFMLDHLPRDAQNLGPAFSSFKQFLLQNGLPARASKHFGDPLKGSACKRMVMYSRWMSRTDKEGIDFGIWPVDSALLSIPLDVHTGRVARSLGLLTRKQDDWKALMELDGAVREILPEDPAKLDYALFGLGVYEGWK